MTWAGTIVAGVSVASSLIGGAAGKKAAKAAAKLKREETAEALRRGRRRNKRTLGRAVAASYASNIQMSGSNRAYIQDLDLEMQREQSWLARAGAQSAAALAAGGSAAMVQGVAQATSTAANWWGSSGTDVKAKLGY
tara:strand:- start:1567 stop:1977 length:411 start_codon:yes stop_codon:yes gene_type:complete